jgi:glycine/D-amino acid oxidase-like deaminating enzyme
VLDERNVLRAVSMQTWDALVIGSGQAGVPLAVALARANRRTAIVERADVGGTCINVGCTPTKTLVASARVAALAGRAAEYGLAGPRFASASSPWSGSSGPEASGGSVTPARRSCEARPASSALAGSG